MCWYQRSFWESCGFSEADCQSHFQSSIISKWGHFVKSPPRSKLPTRPLITLLPHISRPGFGLAQICGRLGSHLRAAVLLFHSLLDRLTYSHRWLLFLFFFTLLFVSLPVFIKLVKFLLQLCQPCIMLCGSHHCALQLPGNWVWLRHVKRQRTPSDTK